MNFPVQTEGYPFETRGTVSGNTLALVNQALDHRILGRFRPATDHQPQEALSKRVLRRQTEFQGLCTGLHYEAIYVSLGICAKIMHIIYLFYILACYQFWTLYYCEFYQ
jgi:hypothetical protein